MRRQIVLGVLCGLVCGCADDLGLEGTLAPCDTDGMTCVWEEGGRCCLGSGTASDCDLWVQDGELTCSPYVGGRVYVLSTGATVSCRPNEAECR